MLQPGEEEYRIIGRDVVKFTGAHVEHKEHIATATDYEVAKQIANALNEANNL